MDTLVVLIVVVIVGSLVVRSFRRGRWAGYSRTLDAREPNSRFTLIRSSFKLFEVRNVIVTNERGTTEIDVILVENTGIFVIEPKEYNAWIFGGENEEKWTARYVNGSTHQFQNPVRQYYRHVMQRRSTKPTSDGEPFLGCRAYPRCTYTGKISATLHAYESGAEAERPPEAPVNRDNYSVAKARSDFEIACMQMISEDRAREEIDYASGRLNMVPPPSPQAVSASRLAARKRGRFGRNRHEVFARWLEISRA